MQGQVFFFGLQAEIWCQHLRSMELRQRSFYIVIGQQAGWGNMTQLSNGCLSILTNKVYFQLNFEALFSLLTIENTVITLVSKKKTAFSFYPQDFNVFRNTMVPKTMVSTNFSLNIPFSRDYRLKFLNLQCKAISTYQ